MKYLKISTKLILIFLATGLLSLTIIGTISVISSGNALRNATTDKLNAICEVRKENINRFYSDLTGEVELIAIRSFVKNTFWDVKHYHDSIHANPLEKLNTENPAYKRIYNKHMAEFKQYLNFKGYSDMYIVCAAHGHILFSANGGSDLGENLSTGGLNDSPIGQCWKNAVESGQIAISELGAYAPAGNKPAQFLGIPVKNNEEKTICILMVQIPVQLINNVLTDTIGLGHSGTTYLVGKDYILRSASRFNHVAALNQKAEKCIVDNSFLELNKKAIVKNTDGNKIIWTSRTLSIPGIEWAIVAEFEQSEAIASANSLGNYIIIVMFLLAIAIVVVAWFFARMLSAPLVQAVTFANSISDGDLTVELNIDRHDEIGQLVSSLNVMKNQLKQTISDVVASADFLANASQQLETSSSMLTQGTSELAASLEDICTSVELMAENTKQNVDNALRADTIAAKASESIKSSNKAIMNSTLSMDEIANKISIVSDIALQTNILALNAAVEAARAGEHGKGFSVVAAEVRKLAERSRTAANEINLLTKKGVETSVAAQKQFEDVVPEIENTSLLVQDIAATSKEQNMGIEQINISIQTLDHVTQQNSIAAEEMTTNAYELAAQAEKLKELVGFFKLNGEKININ